MSEQETLEEKIINGQSVFSAESHHINGQEEDKLLGGGINFINK